MKHLKEYNNLADYEADYYGGKLSFPHVCVINGEVVYAKQYQAVQEKNLPFYIEALEDLTVSLSRSNIQYSLDNEVWVDLSASTAAPTILAGDRMYFKAENLTTANGYGIGTFSISGECNLGGNIMSLAYGDNFEGQTYIAKSYMFQYIFKNQSTIKDASKLILPAMYLTSYAYEGMFFGCSGLICAPIELPCIYGYQYAYQSMFYGCTSLVNAPKIKLATTANCICCNMFRNCTSLVDAPKIQFGYASSHCCDGMFYGCTSLVDAPELPATSINDYCYTYMFYGCTSLVNAPELPAREMKSYCYYHMFDGCTSLVNPPIIGAVTLYGYCFGYMFNGCTSLVTAPEIKATGASSLSYAYDHMFYGCTSLVNVPETLPLSGSGTYNCSYMFAYCTSLERAPILATASLSSNCYQYMFYNCSHLKYIKALFTTTPGVSYTNSWVSGVPDTGTFVKSPDATWTDTFGVSVIPTGWTVEIAEAEA